MPCLSARIGKDKRSCYRYGTIHYPAPSRLSNRLTLQALDNQGQSVYLVIALLSYPLVISD
jgi:hypothetical protein